MPLDFGMLDHTFGVSWGGLAVEFGDRDEDPS